MWEQIFHKSSSSLARAVRMHAHRPDAFKMNKMFTGEPSDCSRASTLEKPEFLASSTDTCPAVFAPCETTCNSAKGPPDVDVRAYTVPPEARSFCMHEVSRFWRSKRVTQSCVPRRIAAPSASDTTNSAMPRGQTEATRALAMTAGALRLVRPASCELYHELVYFIPRSKKRGVTSMF